MLPTALSPTRRPAHPLGPLIYRTDVRHPARVRAAAVAVLAAVVTIFALASCLDPPARGFGAHEQFHLGGACSFPILLGIPCPTCGMTTSFAHLAHGHLVAAVHTQPAGFLIALSLLGFAGLACQTMATGRVWKLNWYRLPPVRVAWLAAAVLLGGWVYKLVTMFPLR